MACRFGAEKLRHPHSPSKARRLIKIVLAVLLLLLLFGGGKQLAKLKSAKTLNLADRLLGAKQGVRQIADGQPYGRGERQTLDIWAPDQAESELPIIIFLYGGGWENGARQDYGFVGRALAARGYLVVIPDYSVAPKAHFPDFIEDVAKATAWIQQYAHSYGGDPRRIVLMGHSAGAYNAAMLALDAQWLARAGADASALRGVVGLAGPYDFLPFKKGSQADRALGRYRPAERTQPIHFVRADAPPFWLASGAKDDVVAPRNSEALARALQAVGAEASYYRYPDLNHAGMIMALSHPFRGKGDVLSDIDIFLSRVTKDAAAPVPLLQE